MRKKHPYYGKSKSTNFPGSPNTMEKIILLWKMYGKQFPSFIHSMGFAVFFSAMGNWWENPCISHVIKYTIGWQSNGGKKPYYAKSMSASFPGFLNTMDFVGYSQEPISQALPIRWIWLPFPMAAKWWENTYISHVMKYTIEWESNGKKTPIPYRKSMSTNFSGSPHTMGFVAFSCTVGNWWVNPCISHMMKYTIRWESYGEKSPMLWEKYEYQFTRFTLYDGLCCISPYHGKLMENPIHYFTYDEIHDRMWI